MDFTVLARLGLTSGRAAEQDGEPAIRKNPMLAHRMEFRLAGAEGIEPSLKVLETSVLPLNQAPMSPDSRGCRRYLSKLVQRNKVFP